MYNVNQQQAKHPRNPSLPALTIAVSSPISTVYASPPPSATLPLGTPYAARLDNAPIAGLHQSPARGYDSSASASTGDDSDIDPEFCPTPNTRLFRGDTSSSRGSGDPLEDDIASPHKSKRQEQAVSMRSQHSSHHPTISPQRPSIELDSDAEEDLRGIDVSGWAPVPTDEPTDMLYSYNHAGVEHASSKSLPTHPHSPSTQGDSSISPDRLKRTIDPFSTSHSTSNGSHSTRPAALIHMSSLPNPTVQRDVDFTMRALIDVNTLSQLVSNGLGRQRFREFLAAEGDTAELDLWTDINHYVECLEDVRANGQAFRALYLSENSNVNVSLTNVLRRGILNTLDRFSVVDSSLGDTQQHLLRSLYQNQFQRFVKHKIIQETHVSLGSDNLAGQKLEGLGECFALTNPRLPDHPIVLVSDGFLQGPGTPPDSVQRIRDGLNSGQGCTELLLNYRRNGEPFYCLLCIIPIRDAQGTIMYFIGGQTNVTGLIATEKDLGFLMGGDSMGMGQINEPLRTPPSPAMLMYKKHTLTKPKSMSSLSVHGRNTGSRVAAGMSASSATVATRPKPSKTAPGFIRSLFGRSDPPPLENSGRQVLLGAEAALSGARPLDTQMALFQDTYKKIMMFKRTKHEITFVTPQLLAYLGLPSRTKRDMFASLLIHKDFTSLLAAGADKTETKHLRAQVKEAVKNGLSLSIHCGLKVFAKSAGVEHKFGMVHLTPMKDADGIPAAFVAVFG